jgi:phosphate:Na+ symporter
VEINNLRLSYQDAKRVGEMFGIVIDMERIGDHAENIAEFAIIIKDGGIKFSDAAMEEVLTISDLVMEIAILSLDSYKNHDTSLLPRIEELEIKIDKLAVRYAKNHIKRLKKENCEPKGGVVFTDMMNDLERIADHSYNIAFSVEIERRVAV